MHLLYARFITKALRDMGYLDFDEPFLSLVHQGLILGKDGEKMSKSKGNTVTPDSYVSTYGSDVFRMYIMFLASYTEGGPWNDDGIKSIGKFLDRVERICDASVEQKGTPVTDAVQAKELEYALNYCIKRVTEDLEVFSFNTALARIMELVNVMYKVSGVGGLMFDSAERLIRVMAPFAPHFAEEMHERMGFKPTVFDFEYPKCDESKLVKDEVEIVVQVNSKIRGKMMISSELTEEEIKSGAVKEAKEKGYIATEPKKVIVVKGRLVNIIA